MRRLLLGCCCFFGLVIVIACRCEEIEQAFRHARKPKQDANGCEMERGFDYKSENPLNDGKFTIVDSPEECCDLCGKIEDSMGDHIDPGGCGSIFGRYFVVCTCCRVDASNWAKCLFAMQREGCKKWVIIRANTKYHKKGECWLVDDDAEKIPCFVCGAGSKPKISDNAPEKNFSGQGGDDNDDKCLIFPGLDFKDGDIAPGVPTSSDEECCNLCKALSSCKAWTRAKSTGNCFMKNIQNEVSMCERCSAGGIIQSRQSFEDKEKLNSLLDIVKEELEMTDNETPVQSKLEKAVDNFLAKVEG